MRLAVLALGVAAACDHRAPIASCAQDLTGVYGSSGERRWMVLDDGDTLEAFPLFPDVPASSFAPLEVAPRVIELARVGPRPVIEGEVHRRYMQRADLCLARVHAAITRCAGDQLELVLADPPPPLSFAPCRWGGRAPTHVERWLVLE
jgi:hypothetical protein